MVAGLRNRFLLMRNGLLIRFGRLLLFERETGSRAFSGRPVQNVITVRPPTVSSSNARRVRPTLEGAWNNSDQPRSEARTPRPDPASLLAKRTPALASDENSSARICAYP
jgi:hypothetical protein